MIAERQRPSVTIKLHKKQMEVYRSKARFRVVVAGRRWGKTSLSRILMITRAKKPRQRIWYVAPTYRMAKQIMWSDLLEAIPKKWVKKINETSMSVTLINGSKIELRGADKPDSLRGVRIDFLVLDEFQDMVPEVWTQALRPTLADSKGDAIFIGTPKAYNYLYEVYRRGQNPLFVERNLWQSWQFPTVTSPFIPASEIESARKDMDEKSFKQEFEASFETMSGRVYYAFDRKVHVKPCEFNPKLPIWIGMDFNVDPMSMVVLQQQPDGTVWAVDEVVLFGSNTEESCDELEKKYWRNQKQITMYPDPAGNQRQHARGETDLDILREKGFKKIKHRKRHPKVADRVNSVNRMLRAADGSIRLYIDPKCVHLIKSLEQTIYKKGSRDMDKDMGVEHSTDALGYPIELEFPIRKFEYKGHSR
jgi:Terminase large subunit, T4likevirus-type, N-terminal